MYNMHIFYKSYNQSISLQKIRLSTFSIKILYKEHSIFKSPINASNATWRHYSVSQCVSTFNNQQTTISTVVWVNFSDFIILCKYFSLLVPTQEKIKLQKRKWQKKIMYRMFQNSAYLFQLMILDTVYKEYQVSFSQILNFKSQFFAPNFASIFSF